MSKKKPNKPYNMFLPYNDLFSKDNNNINDDRLRNVIGIKSKNSTSYLGKSKIDLKSDLKRIKITSDSYSRNLKNGLSPLIKWLKLMKGGSTDLHGGGDLLLDFKNSTTDNKHVWAILNNHYLALLRQLNSSNKDIMHNDKNKIDQVFIQYKNSEIKVNKILTMITEYLKLLNNNVITDKNMELSIKYLEEIVEKYDDILKKTDKNRDNYIKILQLVQNKLDLD